MGLEPTAEPIPVDRVRALRHPDDRERVLAGFREALDGGRDAYEIEYRIVRPDGHLRWIFGRGRVVRDEAGKPVRYSGVDLDITDRKAAEAALAAAKEELERLNTMLEQRVRERTAELEAEARRRDEAEGQLHQAQKMEAVGQPHRRHRSRLQQPPPGGPGPPPDRHPRDPAGPSSSRRRGRRRSCSARRSPPRSGPPANAGQLVQRLLAFSRLQTLRADRRSTRTRSSRAWRT